MITETTISPIRPDVPDDLPEGFVRLSDQTHMGDIDDIAARANAVLNPTETIPAVDTPETLEVSVGIAEHSPRGEVIVISDEARNFYAVIRGRGNVKVSKRAAQTASRALKAFLANNESVQGDSEAAIDFMKRAIDEVDDAVDAADEGLDGDTTNGKEMHYNISTLQIVKDENGDQRAVYANVGKSMIVQDDIGEDSDDGYKHVVRLISQEPDKPEYAGMAEAFNGNKPRLISMTAPLKPEVRFILAADSVPDNIAKSNLSASDFRRTLTDEDCQTAADKLLELSALEGSERVGRAALVIDTPIEFSSKNRLNVVPPIKNLSKEAMHKRLLNVMSQAALSLSSFGIKVKESSRQARTDRIRTTAAKIANVIKLSPLTAANKIADYANKTRGWYGDIDKGSERKRTTISAVAGVLLVAAAAGYIDSRTGGVASHHLSEAHRHTTGHKLGNLSTADKTKASDARATSKKVVHKLQHTPRSTAQKSFTPNQWSHNKVTAPKANAAPAPAAPANTTAPASSPANVQTAPVGYTNQSLTPGSNPWVVARQSLQNSGNLNPTNAQILVQDNAILAASHITAEQATHLPVGFVLRVPPT